MGVRCDYRDVGTAKYRITNKKTIMTKDTAYYTYLTLHLLETHSTVLEGLTCDERWSEAYAHYKLWQRSRFNDDTRSHYDCIEHYARNL